MPKRGFAFLSNLRFLAEHPQATAWAAASIKGCWARADL